MRIDAIIQSTGYSDMLAITLPLNLPAFDTITVYTKRGDEATKAVCARYQHEIPEAGALQCIETDLFTKGGSSFNRGAVYNEAFRRLLQKHAMLRQEPSWICILDSDIVMPPNWREAFEGLSPDKECFYGARRYDVQTMEQWLAVKANQECLRHLTLFRGYGYGYLQLFHPSSMTFRALWHHTRGNPYLEWHDGSWADCAFRLHWGDAPWNPPTQPPDHVLDHTVAEPCDPPTGLLRKLPFNVIHLGIPGVNATGRHTPLWTEPTSL